jgi:hypothetical protein
MQDMHEFYKEQEQQSNKKGIMPFTTYSKAMKYLHLSTNRPTQNEAYTLRSMETKR